VELRHRVSGEVRVLLARTLLGRSPACHVRLGGAATSGEHALVVWTGTGWEIRDLGSTNGTYVGEARLEPGRAHALHAGQRLGFGEPDAPWVVERDEPPGLLLADLTRGTIRRATGRILALPDDETPELLVFEAADGSWVVEDVERATTQPIEDQAVLSVGGLVARIHLPLEHEGTPLAGDTLALDRLTMRFTVSRDEETVRIALQQRGHRVALEPREHGYLLLTLARRRLEAADRPPDERGWVEREQLARMLRVDRNHLNVAIYRARQQLAEAGVAGAAGIVEVRRGQRRIGTDRLIIDVDP
jgi:hypothetical protein